MSILKLHATSDAHFKQKCMYTTRERESKTTLLYKQIQWDGIINAWRFIL